MTSLSIGVAMTAVFPGDITNAPTATTPARMYAPALTVVSDSEISVELVTDVSDGGAPIKSYDLRHSTDEASWTVAGDITDPHGIIGLTASTLYYVQTRAVNDVGTGAWSASAVATTAEGEITDEAANTAGTGTANFTGTLPAQNTAWTGTAIWSEAA